MELYGGAEFVATKSGVGDGVVTMDHAGGASEGDFWSTEWDLNP
jgi:hypothetical protein